MAHVNSLLDSVRRFITSIYDSLKGRFRRTFESLLEKIRDFSSIIQNKKEDIIQWILDIYERFRVLFYDLIASFARFCQAVKECFQKTGIAISQIDLKFTGVTTRVIYIGGIPVPSFETSSPEFTLSVNFQN